MTALAGLSALLLSGCWPAPPRLAEILVGTMPPGASCVLIRHGRPIAAAAPTPAIARVVPSDDPITVACRRRGYAETRATVPSEMTWPGVGTVIYGTPPYDYRHRVDLVMTPQPPARP